MRLTPRYGGDPVITLDGPPADVLGPAVRQRRRLVETLASLTDDEWAHPSRCEGWSNRDVVVHLDSTNAFWAYSITEGVRGEPTTFLATFDPVTSPAELVAATDWSVGEVLDRFADSTESLVGLLESLDGDAWSTLAESPAGHVGIGAVVHHALWDSWVHERDVFLPLDVTPDEEADEITASLRYVAALAPAVALNAGATDRGVLTLSTSDPELAVVVEVGDRVAVREGTASGDLELTGRAVDLVEALSQRAALGQTVPSESAWLVRGLAELFDAG
jgi:uncharacterized protein (TIGR03083 family)